MSIASSMAFHAESMQDLARLPAFLEAACAGADAEACGDLRLATEEVVSNIFEHGYRGGMGPVEIRVDRGPGHITVLLADSAPLFDPSCAPTPYLGPQLEKRGCGGLGWHLVYRVMDEVWWAPGAERGNVYRLVKHLAA